MTNSQDRSKQVPTIKSCGTIEEVVEEMNRRWLALHRAGDWRAVFAKTYLRTTEEILRSTQRPGMYIHPEWAVSIDCAFACRYFMACDFWDAGVDCPWPWRIAFESSIHKKTFVWQDMLLGMNAHINYDLPYALDDTIPVDLTPAELETYRRDHEQLNRVLARAVNVVETEIEGDYDPCMGIADFVMRDANETSTARLIRIWRERSWVHFLLLRNADTRADAEQLIEQSANQYALLLLEFQRAIPGIYWPNRLYRDSVSWLERRIPQRVFRKR